MLPATLTMRLALSRDAGTLAAMSRDLIEHGLPWSWQGARIDLAIRDADTNVLVADNRGSLAGFGIMSYGNSTAHLNLLAVRPGLQRRGIGRHLVRWLETTAQNAGALQVYLELRADNDNAHAFYARLGYGTIGRVPGYYSGRMTAIRMRRDLRVR